MDNKNIYEFPNGFRMIYENPHNNIDVTSIHCLCKMGSINETEHTRGASHFIEHMCFQGTKKINDPEKLSEKYDNYGLYFNAFTEKEFTCYIMNCTDDFLEKSLNLISELMFFSSFNKKTYEKELKVVIQENVNASENYDSIASDVTGSMIFKGSSYECPIDSIKYHRNSSLQRVDFYTKNEIHPSLRSSELLFVKSLKSYGGEKREHPVAKYNKNLKYEDVIEMYKTFYKPHNFVISIVSNTSFKKILGIVKKTHFSSPDPSLRSGEPPRIMINPHIDIQTEPKYVIIKKPGNKTTKISIAFRTCSYFNEDMYKLELIKVIIGELFNSRLFKTLRNDNGLTYNSYVETQYMAISGYFAMQALTEYDKVLYNIDSGNTGKSLKKHTKSGTSLHYRSENVRRFSKSRHSAKKGVLPLMIKIIHDLTKNKLTQKDLDLAKHFKKSQIVMNLSEIENLAIFNGSFLLLKSQNIHHEKYFSLKDLYKTKFEPITLNEINECIKRYFVKPNMNVFMIGEHVLSEKKVRSECEKY
jgi:predicted Zn-dependent peptidase